MDYWTFFVIYLGGGWVGGILTQTIVTELVDRRLRKATAAIRAEIDSHRAIRSRDRLAEEIQAGLATGRTRPLQPAESS